MLGKSESTFDFTNYCFRPVSKELHQALIRFRDQTKERVTGLTGEADKVLKAREYFFQSESRIIGVRVPLPRSINFMGKEIQLPPKTGATIGYWGVEVNNGRRKSTLASFSLPLVSRKGLKDTRYGWVDREELEEIIKVITSGQIVKRIDFERIRR